MCRLLLLKKLFMKKEDLLKLLNHLEASNGGHGNGVAFFIKAKNEKAFNKIKKKLPDFSLFEKSGKKEFLCIVKSIDLKNDDVVNFLYDIKKDISSPILYHTRLVSVGSRKDSLCHPFFSGENKAVAHNGTWTKYRVFVSIVEDILGEELNIEYSDTSIMSIVLNYTSFESIAKTMDSDSVIMLGKNSINIRSGNGGYTLAVLHEKNGNVLAIASEFPKLDFLTEYELSEMNSGSVYNIDFGMKLDVDSMPDCEFEREASNASNIYFNYGDYRDYYSFYTKRTTKNYHVSKRRRPSNFVSPLEAELPKSEAKVILSCYDKDDNYSKYTFDELVADVCYLCQSIKTYNCCLECSIVDMTTKKLIKAVEGSLHELRVILKGK